MPNRLVDDVSPTRVAELRLNALEDAWELELYDPAPGVLLTLAVAGCPLAGELLKSSTGTRRATGELPARARSPRVGHGRSWVIAATGAPGGAVPDGLLEDGLAGDRTLLLELAEPWDRVRAGSAAHARSPGSHAGLARTAARTCSASPELRTRSRPQADRRIVRESAVAQFHPPAGTTTSRGIARVPQLVVPMRCPASADLGRRADPRWRALPS
jgi:hypothetical protein